MGMGSRPSCIGRPTAGSRVAWPRRMATVEPRPIGRGSGWAGLCPGGRGMIHRAGRKIRLIPAATVCPEGSALGHGPARADVPPTGVRSGAGTKDPMQIHLDAVGAWPATWSWRRSSTPFGARAGVRESVPGEPRAHRLRPPRPWRRRAPGPALRGHRPRGRGAGPAGGRPCPSPPSPRRSPPPSRARRSTARRSRPSPSRRRARAPALVRHPPRPRIVRAVPGSARPRARDLRASGAGRGAGAWHPGRGGGVPRGRRLDSIADIVAGGASRRGDRRDGLERVGAAARLRPGDDPARSPAGPGTGDRAPARRLPHPRRRRAGRARDPDRRGDPAPSVRRPAAKERAAPAPAQRPRLSARRRFPA